MGGGIGGGGGIGRAVLGGGDDCTYILVLFCILYYAKTKGKFDVQMMI